MAELAVGAATVGCVVVGLVEWPPWTLVVLVLAAPMGAWLATLVAFERLSVRRESTPRAARAWSAPFLGAAGAAGASLVFTGLVETVGVASAVLVVAAAGLAGVRWMWPKRALSDVAPGGRPNTMEAGPMVPMRYADLDLAELCRVWRASYPSLEAARADPVRLSAAIEQRRACLDELQRRDPVGFARWMASGARAASDPAKFLATRSHDRDL